MMTQQDRTDRTRHLADRYAPGIVAPTNTTTEIPHASGTAGTGGSTQGPPPAVVDDARPRRAVLVAFAIAAVVLVAVPLGLSRLVDQPAGREYRFEIPAGTAARLAAGERVDVLPADLDFALRDRLVVVNHDTVTHQVGPFTVAAGQQIDRRLSQAGSFSGFCTLHSDDRIDIQVGTKT